MFPELSFQVTPKDEWDDLNRRNALWLPVHTPTVQWAGSIRASMVELPATLVNTSGNSVSMNPTFDVFISTANIGADDRGIVVGTGPEQASHAAWEVEDQVMHGSGIGELSYSAMTIGSTIPVGLTTEWTIHRVFTAANLVPLLVTQVGLYTRNRITGWKWCMIQDNLSAPTDFGTTLPIVVAYKFAMG